MRYEGPLETTARPTGRFSGQDNPPPHTNPLFMCLQNNKRRFTSTTTTKKPARAILIRSIFTPSRYSSVTALDMARAVAGCRGNRRRRRSRQLERGHARTIQDLRVVLALKINCAFLPPRNRGEDWGMGRLLIAPPSLMPKLCEGLHDIPAPYALPVGTDAASLGRPPLQLQLRSHETEQSKLAHARR